MRPSGRTYQRMIKKPARFHDAAPTPKRRSRRPYHDILPAPPPMPDDTIQATQASTPEHITPSNSYGVYRIYPDGIPSWTPEERDALEKTWAAASQHSSLSNIPYFSPFANETTFLLMYWLYTGSSTKTIQELGRLVDEVLLSPNFNVHDLNNFQAGREARHLDAGLHPHFTADDTWKEACISISLPCEKVKAKSEDQAPKMVISGVFHKDIIEIMKSVLLQDTSASQFHQAPFYEYWRPDERSVPERIYSEIYTTDAFIEEHRKIQANNMTPEVETVICSFLLHSDATHLTNFGTASLWPIYLYFGNISKYQRCILNSFAVNHVAYIPKVSINPFFSY